jgi:hypothetical protein
VLLAVTAALAIAVRQPAQSATRRARWMVAAAPALSPIGASLPGWRGAPAGPFHALRGGA